MPQDEQRLSNAIQQAQERIGEDFTESLLTLSYRYLDQYYLQVRRHSEQSLLLTLIFAFLGGLTVLAGIAASLFWGLAEQSYIAVGAGILTDFIAAIFFYLYNQTTKEMNAYYDRLVLAQNLAIAIKTADMLEGAERTAEFTAVIAALLTDYNKYLFENSMPLTNDLGNAGKEKERTNGTCHSQRIPLQ